MGNLFNLNRRTNAATASCSGRAVRATQVSLSSAMLGSENVVVEHTRSVRRPAFWLQNGNGVIIRTKSNQKNSQPKSHKSSKCASAENTLLYLLLAP